jgi:hypothetical protein
MDEKLYGEGLYEFNEFMEDHSKIEEFDPKTDPIAKKIDFDLYVVKNIDELDPPLPEEVIDDEWLND